MLARHSVAWRYETALTGTVQLRMSRIVWWLTNQGAAVREPALAKLYEVLTRRRRKTLMKSSPALAA